MIESKHGWKKALTRIINRRERKERTDFLTTDGHGLDDREQTRMGNKGFDANFAN